MKYLVLVSLLAGTSMIQAADKTSAIVERLQELGANGGHSIVKTKYKDSEGLTFKEEKKEVFELKGEIYDYGRCLDSKFNSFRTLNIMEEYKKEYTTSILKHLYKGVKEMAYYSEDHETTPIIKGLWKDISTLINDERTIHVLYSGFNEYGQDIDHSEGCTMYKLRIFRNDGTVIRLNFDYTD